MPEVTIVLPNILKETISRLAAPPQSGSLVAFIKLAEESHHKVSRVPEIICGSGGVWNWSIHVEFHVQMCT